MVASGTAMVRARSYRSRPGPLPAARTALVRRVRLVDEVLGREGLRTGVALGKPRLDEDLIAGRNVVGVDGAVAVRVRDGQLRAREVELDRRVDETGALHVAVAVVDVDRSAAGIAPLEDVADRLRAVALAVSLTVTVVGGG